MSSVINTSKATANSILGNTDVILTTGEFVIQKDVKGTTLEFSLRGAKANGALKAGPATDELIKQFKQAGMVN